MLTVLYMWFKDWWQGKPTSVESFQRDILERGFGRSREWPKVRKAHLTREYTCQWCGSLERLEVHHIKPFHIYPQLELDDDNLITLCESGDEKCHLIHGHLGNYRKFNALIRDQVTLRTKEKDA